MTSSLSTSMVFSSDEMAQNVSHSSVAMTSSGVKLCETGDVREYKRSRFDEAENYKLVGHVGSGGYGNCLLLQNRSNMTLRVCKIQKRSKSISEPLEIEVLRDILHDHPRIIRLHDAIMHNNTMQLYFDFYPAGDLHKLMVHHVREWQNFPESFLWHCLLQLSEGLAYIHHGYDRRLVYDPTSASKWQPIIHGDIKPENIFLGPPTPDSHGYPSLVLGDFGLVSIDEQFVSGTWKWQPPELPATSTKADVWALGAVIHALAHDGEPPLLPRPHYMAPSDFYRFPGARAPMPLEGMYSTELHDLVIHGTLLFHPQARYSSLEVLQCVVDEMELGVASDMDWEPLLGPKGSEKTFDENGVTENATESCDESLRVADSVCLQKLDPIPDMDWEPLLGSKGPEKTYDENGVTENATESCDESLRAADSVYLQGLDPMPCYDPMDGGMEYAGCTQGWDMRCM